MAIRVGISNLKKKFIGSTEVNFVRLGATLLYKSITQFVTEYVSRVAADGGTTENTANVNTLLQDLRNKDLFEDATFVLVPSGVKTSKVYSEIPENGNGDLTVTRNSTATRTNSNQLIESVAANVLRIDYSQGVPCILLEPQRTNLLLRSEELEDSYWQKSGATISPNQILSPNNVLSSDLLTESNLNERHRFLRLVGTLGGETSFFTLSCFVKSQNRNRVSFFVEDFKSPQVNRYAFVFNLSSKLFTKEYILGNNISVSKSYQDAPNGYTRLILVFRSEFTSPSITVQFSLSDSDNPFEIGLVPSYQGDGVSGAFFWGTRLEIGAFQTTYAPTTSTNATRLADFFTRNNLFTNGQITNAGGTWFIELRNNIAYTRDAASRGIFLDTSSTSLTNGFNIANSGTGRLKINKTIGGTTTELYTTLTDTVKIAIKWNGTIADIFVNGIKVVAATSFTPLAMEHLGGYAEDVPKYIAQSTLHPTPLTDTKIQNLTTI